MRSAPGLATRLALVPVLVCLAACDSAPRRPEDRPDDPPSAADASARDGGEKIVVPRQCLQQLAEFVNREQLLLADHLVLEGSSDPFFMSVTSANDPDSVERTEGVDAARKMSVFSLRNRSGLDTVEEALPQVRVGDGFRVVGTRDIVARFHNRVTKARPIWLRIEASGRVVYYDSHSGRRLTLDGLEIVLEIVRVGDGYMFRSRIG